MKIWFFGEPWIFLKGALVFILGPLSHQPAYLLVAIVVDLIFGIQVAIKTKTFRRKILFHKFGRKVSTYLLWIVMFHAFDMATGLPDTARWSLISILVGLEITSAIKNTTKLGYGVLAEAISALYLNFTKHKGGSTDEHPTQRSTDHNQNGDGSNL